MDIITEIKELTSVTIDGGMEYKPTVIYMTHRDYRRYKRKRFFERVKKIFK